MLLEQMQMFTLAKLRKLMLKNIATRLLSLFKVMQQLVFASYFDNFVCEDDSHPQSTADFVHSTV